MTAYGVKSGSERQRAKTLFCQVLPCSLEGQCVEEESIPANIERGCEPELQALAQVVEPDGSPESTELGHSCGDTVGGGSHFCGIKLSSQ